MMFLLEMFEKNKNEVKKHALFKTPFFLVDTRQNNENASKTIQNKVFFRPGPALDYRCGGARETNRSGGLFLSLKTFQSLGE